MRLSGQMCCDLNEHLRASKAASDDKLSMVLITDIFAIARLFHRNAWLEQLKNHLLGYSPSLKLDGFFLGQFFILLSPLQTVNETGNSGGHGQWKSRAASPLAMLLFSMHA